MSARKNNCVTPSERECSAKLKRKFCLDTEQVHYKSNRRTAPVGYNQHGHDELNPTHIVCGGHLKHGQWGCGQEFINLESFIRHLRSQAGGRCLEPLWYEERMEGGNQFQELLSSHGNEKMLAAVPAVSARTFDETQLIGIALPATMHPPGVSKLVNNEASEQLDVNCDSHQDDYWQIPTPGPAYVFWWYAYTAAMSSRSGQ